MFPNENRFSHPIPKIAFRNTRNISSVYDKKIERRKKKNDFERRYLEFYCIDLNWSFSVFSSEKVNFLFARADNYY